MPELHAVFLSSDPLNGHNDNAVRLPAAFADAGWNVSVTTHESLHIGMQGLQAGDISLTSANLIWPVGFGARASYFDRTQMLATLPPHLLINNPTAMLMLHGKFGFAEYTPHTCASTDPQDLLRILADGGDWVLKPAAASFGRGVERISNNNAGHQAIRAAFASAAGGAMLLQRWVDVDEAERRTLVINGHVLGTYARSPTDGIRANLASGGTAHAAALSIRQSKIVQDVSRQLLARGIRFAAIDTLGNYLMEVNVANPGGLETLTGLYGGNPALELAQHMYSTCARTDQPDANRMVSP